MPSRRSTTALTVTWAVLFPIAPTLLGQEPLDRALLREGPAALATEARATGDASRGAALFAGPSMACARCHAAGEDRPSIGPDLTRPGRAVTPTEVVESVLDPSKVIAKGFETITIQVEDGRVLVGLLAEETPDAIVLRDPTRDGETFRVARAEIDDRRDGGASLMPAGVVNALGSRRDFLDLARYLIEIAEGGADRARQLKPDAATLARLIPPIPEYEKEIDHARLIAGLDTKSYERGQAIYRRVCTNCHGTLDEPGSLPTSPRFASATLRNGADPYALYRTLTHGFGLMTPQTWMVPQQKYDVIHYVREAFFRPHNPALYAKVDRRYLDGLPAGTSLGPEPSTIEAWSAMDYGPTLSAAIEVGQGSRNIAAKGLAIRLDPGHGGVARGRAFVLYDLDTMRLAAAWTGEGFLDWEGIQFNGRHAVHPRIVGETRVADEGGPAWANPLTGDFDDPHIRGRDGKPCGPLPREWLRYRGRYQHGDGVVLDYSVGEAEILEQARWLPPGAPGGTPAFARVLEIGPSSHPLILRAGPDGVAAAVSGSSDARIDRRDGVTLVTIPPSTSSRRLGLFLSDGDPEALGATAARAELPAPRKTGPPLWAGVVTTRAIPGDDRGPFAVDALTVPEANPWNALVRPGGFDFPPGGRSAAVCTWDGDVWTVEGLDDPEGMLRWRRVASGLFQPLGLKVREGAIFVGCRDQIAVLRDHDGDGEYEHLECFNTDHQVTEHFHEFAMGLQADEDGNFYYAKAARHALKAVVPQHGTLLKVGADGSHTEILATGFRAPNGVCLNSDGTFYLTDQEGHWTPKNRVNRVRPGGFHGNLWGYTDVTDTSDTAMEEPVCWITNRFDRSPSEPLWVTTDHPAWASLKGSLLNFSYGFGTTSIVLREEVGGREQGGVANLPIPAAPTGLFRGRFRPADGHLYTCGMYAWAGDRTQPGGFFRVRATGRPMHAPVGLHAREKELTLTFTDPLDREAAIEPGRYTVRAWGLTRGERYGSDHVDEHALEVTGVAVSADGRSVTLKAPGLRPSRGMELRYGLKSPDGTPVEGVVHHTIHRLAD